MSIKPGELQLHIGAIHGPLVGRALHKFGGDSAAQVTRYQQIKGYSPEDVPKATVAVSGRFDLIFIDAVHTYSAVKVVLPHLADGGFVLFHDASHQGVNQATDEFLADNPDFTDLGIL